MSSDAAPRRSVRTANLVIDCTDIEGTARFWADLLGMQVTQREQAWLDLEPLVAGGPTLSFQRVPETKSVKNRLHLDLQVPDIGEAGEHARNLGAAPASPVHEYPGDRFQVWRDPEGNEFCFIAGRDH